MLRIVTNTAKFAAFQRRIGSRPLAAGLLELLWHFTASSAADGGIGRHTDEEIEAWIGWDGVPGALVATLVDTRWVDRVEGNARLYVHDWHDHADRSVHMKLARERRRFVNGSDPKFGYLPAEERRAASEWYAAQPAEVRRTPAEVVGQGQEQGPGAGAEAAAPPTARSNGSRRGSTPAPDALSPEQTQRLHALVWKNRPWLLAPGMEDTTPHCHRRWVEAQVQEVLTYWRGRGVRKADWVLTCANRIYAEDGRRWEKLGQPPPIARIFHERFGAEAPA